mgnify:CR=1 FL=1
MRTNFQMTDENITMVSGDTLSFNVVVKDQNGEPVAVDGASFKAKHNLAGSTVAISKSLGDGITQADGVLTVRIAPADTANLVGFFYYDMDITVGSDRFTLLRGMLQIEYDVKSNA